MKTVPHLLLDTINRYPDKDALRFHQDNTIASYSYRDFGKLIDQTANGMAALGLKAGDRVAILSTNRPEWTISDFAVFTMRGIVIPIYPTLPANQVAYILKDSGARAVFVENIEQYDKLKTIESVIPDLEFIISYEAIENVRSYQYLLVQGAERATKSALFTKESLDQIDPEEVCSIVYTSGTTGNPKGVMLHHKGFVTDIINAEARFNLFDTDVFLSFLPLSHLYERLAGHWCPMYRGATIHYARSIDTVIEDIAVAKPTVIVSVPRLYEKIAAVVHDQVEQSSVLHRRIFHWAMETGSDYHERLHDGQPSLWLRTAYGLADRLAFKKIKTKLGGSLRCPISGGAPLSIETLKFFQSIGLQIIEGYGITETHLILTLTPLGKIKYGSCGLPIEGIQVRTDANGEILVRGDTVMAGYYNKPELIHDVIDHDGWYYTGDIGYLDEDNYLYLTDRKKNIIVTCGGKNVAPAPIENVLKTSRYIDDVCLVGDKRKFISALIIPNSEALMQWAIAENIAFAEEKELYENVQVLNMLTEEIDTLQSDFAQYERVKKIAVLPEPLTIEKGELTPSLKIKRNVIEERYKALIDTLYEL